MVSGACFYAASLTPFSLSSLDPCNQSIHLYLLFLDPFAIRNGLFVFTLLRSFVILRSFTAWLPLLQKTIFVSSVTYTRDDSGNILGTLSQAFALLFAMSEINPPLIQHMCFLDLPCHIKIFLYTDLAATLFSYQFIAFFFLLRTLLLHSKHSTFMSVVSKSVIYYPLHALKKMGRSCFF